MTVSLRQPEVIDAYASIRENVINLLEERRIPLGGNTDQVRIVVQECVQHYQARAHLGSGRALADPTAMGSQILASVTDFGPLADLFARPDIEEIFIEGDEVAYIDGQGRLQGLTVPTTEAENLQTVERLLATGERHLDAKSPIVQARILGGQARLTACIPPVADVLSATIRKHTMRRETLQSLVERGTLGVAAASFLRAAIHAKSSLVVSGSPGTGKTTMASACIASIPSHHCIRVCEEIRELNVPVIHGQYYEARPPALDGSGEITLRHLVKFILAMRPDLIVVGEVRGAEAFELTRAVNAGTGFMCTVHANSANDALEAIVNAAIMAGENVGIDIVRKVFSSSIDLVCFMDKEDIAHVDAQSGIRREMMEIIAVEPSLSTTGFTTVPVFQRKELGAPLEWTGAIPSCAEHIQRVLPAGVSIHDVLSGKHTFL
jgi:pilus assembly protein CpaF